VLLYITRFKLAALKYYNVILATNIIMVLMWF